MQDKCYKLCHPNFSFFLLAVSWFFLVVFQFLAILNAFLVLRDSWGAKASTLACCRQFLRLLYFFSYVKERLFFSHLLYVILLLQNLSKN